MNSQFSLKDYLNYTISGILWIFIFLYFLIEIHSICLNTVLNFGERINIDIICFAIIFFGGYLLGNILRFTDCFIKNLNILLFGSPYYYALKADKEKEQCGLGRTGKFFRSGNLSIGEKDSKRIETKLLIYGILKEDKQSQYILVENFLSNKINNKKAERMNDLKNFYDSVSAPVFAILIILLREITISNAVCTHKIIVWILILIVWCKFIDRYRFLYSNYIKETYRNLLFIK